MLVLSVIRGCTTSAYKLYFKYLTGCIILFGSNWIWTIKIECYNWASLELEVNVYRWAKTTKIGPRVKRAHWAERPMDEIGRASCRERVYVLV